MQSSEWGERKESVGRVKTGPREAFLRWRHLSVLEGECFSKSRHRCSAGCRQERSYRQKRGVGEAWRGDPPAQYRGGWGASVAFL